MLAPEFEKKPNCGPCGVKFGVFTRQHHCRNCGRSVCGACSGKSLPLPKYGITEAVRVCNPCYTAVRSEASSPSPSATAASSPAPVSPHYMTPAARASASYESPEAKETAPAASASFMAAEPAKVKKVSNCTCGLPLCKCPPDEEEKVPEPVREKKSEAAPAPAPKRDTPAPIASTFSGFGGYPSASAPAAAYDLNGDLNEQCRDAIKNGDLAGVKKLVAAGANVRYVDRTGNTFVHLAAMFNRGDMVSVLVDAGADVMTKNQHGETAIDLAPPALGNKMGSYVKA